MARVAVQAGSVSFRCPGCGWTHMLNTDTAQRPCWAFDGDANAPTLSPSINASRTFTAPDRADVRCHSFVEAGRIRFLPDCTHALVGQTVDLPEIGA